MAEIGLSGTELAGASLLAGTILLFTLLSGTFAARYKGRSAIAWATIAVAAQAVALSLPVAIIGLTGLADPRDLITATNDTDFSTFRLFTEMSTVAGFTTIAVLSFLSQTKWKTCPACENRIPWRARTCPHCASSQTVSPVTTDKLEPGSYPRLKSRTIHLPVELDLRLKKRALPIKKRFSMTEEAAVSQYVRDLLMRFDSEFEKLDEEREDGSGSGGNV